MAVIATLTKGYDLDYIWRQVDRSLAKDAAGYYIQASESGGEPPGRWWGPGAKALGLEHGQVVECEPYDLLFGERKAPDGTQLGRPPGSGQNTADIYARLLAAEPHATAERRHELRAEAARQARQSPLYFDLTLSLSKSISIFHASLGENARLAREAGDQAGNAYWSGLVAEVDDMIWQATWAGFGYFQREAGYTRTGSHHARVHGQETGQWHEADLAVAHWLQHTSRDGDMQLHVHSQIAHTARTATDGKWRAPDSLGYNEHIGAVAAITAQHLEEALTCRFGVQWVARDDGHGFEIKGISGEMMRLFSSRRESITADVRGRAVRFEQRYGRPVAAGTGAARAGVELQHAQGEGRRAGLRAAARRVGGQARAHARRPAGVGWHDGAGHAAARKESPDPLELIRAAQKAVALAQQERSTWTRSDLIKYLGRVLPRTGMEPAAVAPLIQDLADRCARHSRRCSAWRRRRRSRFRSPLRADGRSIYQRHGGVRYATRAQLATEGWLLTQRRNPATAADRARRAADRARPKRHAVPHRGQRSAYAASVISCCSPLAPASRSSRGTSSAALTRDARKRASGRSRFTTRGGRAARCWPHSTFTRALRWRFSGTAG